MNMSNLEYVSIDLVSPLAMYNMDITNLQLDDSSFDVILCSHVLEHIKEDLVAIKELFRILKPNRLANWKRFAIMLSNFLFIIKS